MEKVVIDAPKNGNGLIGPPPEKIRRDFRHPFTFAAQFQVMQGFQGAADVGFHQHGLALEVYQPEAGDGPVQRLGVRAAFPEPAGLFRDEIVQVEPLLAFLSRSRWGRYSLAKSR